VPLRPILTEVAERAGEGGTVEIAVRASGEVAALADRELLYQALANVAANALKHTHEGEVALEARDLGRTVEVEVRDTGRGMERTAAAHAFDRFYRSSLREDDGFGLGLAIANDAVVAMGGSIALESTPNVGTRVWIRLPSAKIVSE
jgi:signal transduction histidine kinase